MSYLKIDDLASSKEMDKKAMDAVVGGFSMAGGQYGGQNVSSGWNIFSPTIGVNLPINVPVAIDIDTSSLLNVDADLANVIGSTGTVVA